MKTRFLSILLAIALLTALTACESPAAPDDSGTFNLKEPMEIISLTYIN